MGGLGSGRSLGGSRRNTVEEYPYCLSVSWMRKNGLIPDGHLKRCTSKTWYNRSTGEVANSVMLMGFVTEDGYNNRVDVLFKDGAPVKKQSIGIGYTKSGVCNRRAWLLCPKCFKNRSKLYASGPNRPFNCRECCGLVYQSQRHDRMARLFTRARNIHRKLYGNGDLTTGVPIKPYNMHWKTYERKCQEMKYYCDLGYAYMGVEVAKFKEQINKF